MAPGYGTVDHGMPIIDAHRIIRRLYQGSLPPAGPWLRHAGFDVLVLAARELQPSASRFPGLVVYHVPLEDDPGPLTSQERRVIRRVSRLLAAHHRAGKRVLITCAAGWNRSGIITAATLRRITGAPHDAIVDRIRRKRSPRALGNRDFVRAFKQQHLGSVGY